MRTSPDDEPFTSHFPRQPCAPHPHTRPCFTCDGAHVHSRHVETEQPGHAHAELAVVDLDAAVLGHDPEEHHGAVRAGEPDREARGHGHSREPR